MERREEAEARSLAAAWALVAAGLRMPDGTLEAAIGDRAFLRETDSALSTLDPGDVEGLRGAWARYRQVAAREGRVGLVRERARVLGRSALEREVPLSIQAEVLALFTLQRALAGGRGDGAMVEGLRFEERRSLQARLGRLLPLFLERTETREPGGSIAAVARLAAGIARIHSRAMGLTPWSQEVPLPAPRLRPSRFPRGAVHGTYAVQLVDDL